MSKMESPKIIKSILNSTAGDISTTLITSSQTEFEEDKLSMMQTNVKSLFASLSIGSIKISTVKFNE